MQTHWILMIGLALSACAVTPNTAETKAAATKLPAQKLAPGECGMFVWSVDQDRSFILFSQSQKQTGLWINDNDGAINPLTITKQSGAIADAQYPTTEYQVDGLTSLKLALRKPETITDGTRYKAGTLTVSIVDAWERVSPVVGLSACQPL